MQTREVLRVKIYQPTTHFRVPFSYQRRFTYPLPPYSTAKGLLCNLAGIKNDNGFNSLISSLAIGIYGEYETNLTEFIWFRNLSGAKHTATYKSDKNRTINGVIMHPGGQSPTKIDVLENARFTIYFYHDDLGLIEQIFNNPTNRLSTIHLGRSEDWLVFEEIKRVKLEIKSLRSINKSCWIPEKPSIRFEIENYANFFQNINANTFNLTSIYELIDNQRAFTRYQRAKLFEGGAIPAIETFCDNEENLPLFMADLKESR